MTHCQVLQDFPDTSQVSLHKNNKIKFPFYYVRSRRSSGSIVSDYGLDDRGSIPDRGRGFFFKPLRPDRLWGPPSLLYNGFRGSFPRGVKSDQGVMLTTYPHLVLRLIMSRSYTSSPPVPPWRVAGSLLPIL
jgi:hypothetical protein